MDEKSRHLRARLANVARNNPDDVSTREELRREFGAARLEDYITRTLATFPPLTQEQRDRLAVLLRASSNAGDAVA